jgi:two-component system, cell cycle response regulator
VNILIAEDDATSRLVLGATLRKLGHTVTAVSNGRDAWNAWRGGEVSLIISDWMMPEIDGLDLCRMIRAEHGLQYTYIILLTSRNGRESHLGGIDSGADDFITKPFDEGLLAARLHVAARILDLHEKLRIQATHDPLTGVWNRGAILDTLAQELKRSAREGRSTGVILADLDHFKRVNDTHGHLVGDAVLCEAARRMNAALRAYDRLGRYGGEEFLIVLPGMSDTDSMSVAHRIRASVSGESVFAPPATYVPMTLSLGVVVSRGASGDSPEALIGAADEALYRAKAAGRDRCELARNEAAAGV